PHGTITKPPHEGARIIDSNRFDFATQIVFTLLDEGRGHRRDMSQRAIQPQGHVDIVSEKIACDAASGDRRVKTPETFAALWKILRDRPILKELRSVVEDAAEPSLVEKFFQQHECRNAPVVVPDHVRTFRRFYCIE